MKILSNGKQVISGSLEREKYGLLYEALEELIPLLDYEIETTIEVGVVDGLEQLKTDMWQMMTRWDTDQFKKL